MRLITPSKRPRLRGLLLACLAAPLATAVPAAARATGPVTEEEAHAIGVDAYLYFYPLVTMDMTRKQLTNIEPGKESARPDEHVRQCPGFPPADLTGASCGRISIRSIRAAGSI